MRKENSMNRNDVEKNITHAFQSLEHSVSVEEILSDCKTERQVFPMKQTNNKTWVRFATLAISCALLFGIFFSFQRNTAPQLNQTVAATISLDVNPSIEIQINSEEKVLNVQANNEDAEVIIGDMDFVGSDLKVTINALIGSLVRNGYLNEVTNSILISVDNPDQEKAFALEQQLLEEINQIVDHSSILYQYVTEDDEAKELSNRYGITQGKAQLVKEVVEENTTLYTYDDLANLSIHELNLLKRDDSGIQRTGAPSDKGYIGFEKAKQLAFQHLGVSESQVFLEKVELDYEKGRMVYEVEFTYQNIEYEYTIDAQSGEILEIDRDYDDDNDHDYSPWPVTPQESSKSITLDQARQIALQHAGVTNPYDLEVELDDGKYEVDFKANGYEYEYDISLTGTILKVEKEIDD